MYIYFTKNLFAGLALGAMALVGCADERNDHPVFLDDLNDVERFPRDDRKQLSAEHANLPRSLVVRVPIDDKGEPRAQAQAEVRHFDNLDSQQLSGERMASMWDEGRTSARTRLAHNLRHVARDHERDHHRSTQHDVDDHRYGHGRRHHHGYKRGHRHHGYKRGHRHHGYRNYPLYVGNYARPMTYYHTYYRPYYRSSYYPNTWWGNYRFYNTYYYQPSRYRYFVYYPNTTAYCFYRTTSCY